MEKQRKKMRRGLCIMLIFMMLVPTGCGKKKEIEPSAKEISEKFSAAGYLASLVEKSKGFIGSDDKSDQAYLYDNAIALYALCEVGAVWHAEKLANAIVFAQEHDRTFHDGRLRNVYLCGDPAMDSGYSVASGTVPLPGFWQNGKWYEDFYSVSTSTGNMAWTILALCRVSRVVPEQNGNIYLNAAKNAAGFLLGLSSATDGFTAGYEGWDKEQQKVTYKSTEHNIACYAAFSVLANLLEEKEPKAAAEYRQAAESASKFVLSMYDEEKCCFYTGTESDGETVNTGVIPIDATALSVLALTGRVADPEKSLEFIKKNMAVGVGFDFSAGDLDGIWNEGTAQMALCYLKQNREEEYNAAMGYLRTQEYKNGGIPAADRDGVSTGFVLSGTEEVWEYNNTLSIGATGGYALAQVKVNPLEQ